MPAVPFHMCYIPEQLRVRVPKDVHGHWCCSPVRARIRQLIRQPSKVRPDYRVTRDARPHERALRHARKCSNEGAAHAQVPQGGDGFQSERRGVDVVVRVRKVRRTAHTCRTSHAHTNDPPPLAANFTSSLLRIHEHAHLWTGHPRTPPLARRATVPHCHAPIAERYGHCSHRRCSVE